MLHQLPFIIFPAIVLPIVLVVSRRPLSIHWELVDHQVLSVAQVVSLEEVLEELAEVPVVGLSK